MKKKYLFTLSLLSILGLVFGAFWWSNSVPAQAEKQLEAKNSIEMVNSKAKNSRGGDLEAAKELVGEIITGSGFEAELRGFTSNSIKERVGNAESLYQTGQIEGISEANVARTINGLAIKLNLPEFAKTDSYEIRKLRISLVPSYPELIGKKPNGTQPIFAGQSFESKMSPAESILVLTMMMHQKMGNKDYQLTKQERMLLWEQKYYKGGNSKNQTSLEEITKNRSKELNNAIQQGAKRMSTPDALQLSTLILNTLGVRN